MCPFYIDANGSPFHPTLVMFYQALGRITSPSVGIVLNARTNYGHARIGKAYHLRNHIWINAHTLPVCTNAKNVLMFQRLNVLKFSKNSRDLIAFQFHNALKSKT